MWCGLLVWLCWAKMRRKTKFKNNYIGKLDLRFQNLAQAQYYFMFFGYFLLVSLNFILKSYNLFFMSHYPKRLYNFFSKSSSHVKWNITLYLKIKTNPSNKSYFLPNLRSRNPTITTIVFLTTNTKSCVNFTHFSQFKMTKMNECAHFAVEIVWI